MTLKIVYPFKLRKIYLSGVVFLQKNYFCDIVFDIFDSIIFTAISSLLKELEAIVDGPLLSLQRMPWTVPETVSGESHYVASLTQAVQDMVNVVQERVEQKKYLRIFFDKASM